MTQKEHSEHDESDHKIHRHHKKGPRVSGTDYFMIATVILAVLLIISVFTAGFGIIAAKNGFGKSKILAPKTAADKSVAFINTYLLKSGNALLKNVTEEKGVYKMTIVVEGNEYDSYITKDGAMLFPSAIDMSKAIPKPETPKPAQIPKTDKPSVLLFTMSYCPYGNIAEDGMMPAAKLLGTAISFEPHYVIYQNYGGGGPDYCLGNGTYCSMHGIQELNEGIRELCIWKYDSSKFWDFIKSVNTECNYKNVDACWENVAKAKGIGTARIKKCYDDEKLALLALELQLNEKYGVQGSPTLVINGAEYQGGRSPENYKTAICSAMNTPAKECNQTLSATATGAEGGCES